MLMYFSDQRFLEDILEDCSFYSQYPEVCRNLFENLKF